MNRVKGLVAGVGINDSDYPVVDTKSDPPFKCPYYIVWTNMINRCYNKRVSETKPWHVDCEVCEDWKTFSKFKTWMDKQDWEGKQLDKDLLVEDNKVYSPDTCVFIPKALNVFLTMATAVRGEYPVGVTRICKHGKEGVRSFIRRDGKKTILKNFSKDVGLCHRLWQEAKRDILIKEWIPRYDDPRVLSGLIRIRDKLQYHIDNQIETTSL